MSYIWSIPSFINYVYWKINGCKDYTIKSVEIGRSLHAAMVYGINKSRDLKKKTGNHICKKVFESMIMTEKRMSCYMHIIFLTKILGIFAVSLNLIIIQNLIKKKNASKVPNNLLKSNCEFEG